MSSHCWLLLDLPTNRPDCPQTVHLVVHTPLLPTICSMLLQLHLCLVFILPTFLHTSSYFVLPSPLHTPKLAWPSHQPCWLSPHTPLSPYTTSASHSFHSVSDRDSRLQFILPCSLRAYFLFYSIHYPILHTLYVGSWPSHPVACHQCYQPSASYFLLLHPTLGISTVCWSLGHTFHKI